MKNWNPLLMLFALILLVLTGWWAGKVESKREKESLEQLRIDSLKFDLLIEKAKYEIVQDSLKAFKDRAFDRIEIINEVKKTIKNEIRNQNKTIRAIPDSLVQRYVDSIRSNGGFY